MFSVGPDTAQPGSAPEDIPLQRKNLRRAAIAAREALAPEQHARLTAALAGQLLPLLERLRPSCLGFCWPHRAEPDLRDSITHWLAADAQRVAALPQVQDPLLPMQFRAWAPGTPLEEDRHGIPTPSDSPVVRPDVLLIPLNAFDAAGFRLGYGGGYFDRTLAALEPAPLAIGVGFELGRVHTTHPQPHDKPMGWIVTESGCWQTA